MTTAAPRLVLHVGAYKTATSTLQSLFTLHEAEIAATYGVHYPRTFRRVNSGSIIAGHPKTDSFAHHMVSHLLRQPEDPDRAVLTRQFAEMTAAFRASGCRSLFLSSELLSFCSRTDKAFLLERLAEFDLRIVYAVRNPVDYVESMNNQALKSGERLRRRSGWKPPQLAFLENIDDWIGLVGSERVRVLAFSAAHFADFCRDFFDVFEDPAFGAFTLKRMPRTNSSISAEGARLRLMLNQHLPRPKDMGRKRRHIVTRLVTELDARLERRTPLVTLGSDERQAVQEANRAGMDTICERFLPRELWPVVTVPERGLVARRTDLDEAVYAARDLDHVAACLLRARALFAEGPAPAQE